MLLLFVSSSNVFSTKFEDLPDDKNGSQRPPTIIHSSNNKFHICGNIYMPKVTFFCIVDRKDMMD